MDELIKRIARYPNGTTLVIEWEDGCIAEGKIDTIYETFNDLEFHDPDYKEFYACAFFITNIIHCAKKENHLAKGDLIEISNQKPPLKIYLEDNTVIWESNYSNKGE